MSEPLRVGIIGANPVRGWASRAHLPVIAASDDVELVAVATTRIGSATEAARKFGARSAYADPLELVADPQVEAVTVAVKVPDHLALVQAALEAGKHVYCEWPVGANTVQAVTLRDLAAKRGLHTVVGLQSARAAQIARARELVGDGRIGRVLSATLRSAAAIGGPSTSAADAWRADAANGTNALTVTAGHALDTLAAVTGELEALSATVGTRVPQATVADTGDTITITSPDQIAIAGTARDGIIVAAHIQGATRTRPGMVIEVRGTDGLLEITAAPSLSAATAQLQLVLSGQEPVDVPGRVDDPVACVGHLYSDLAAAVRTGRPHGPDFEHAVRRHRLLDAIRESSIQHRQIDIRARDGATSKE